MYYWIDLCTATILIVCAYLGLTEFLYVHLFYTGCAVQIIDIKCRLYINNFVKTKPPFLLARSIFTFCDQSNGTVAKIYYPAIINGKISGKLNVITLCLTSKSCQHTFDMCSLKTLVLKYRCTCFLTFLVVRFNLAFGHLRSQAMRTLYLLHTHWSLLGYKRCKNGSQDTELHHHAPPRSPKFKDHHQCVTGKLFTVPRICTHVTQMGFYYKSNLKGMGNKNNILSMLIFGGGIEFL